MRLKLHRKHSTPMFGGKFSIFASIMNVFAASSRFNKIYYNITTNKFELYLTTQSNPNNDVIVTLNGLSLANNIDYYMAHRRLIH